MGFVLLTQLLKLDGLRVVSLDKVGIGFKNMVEVHLAVFKEAESLIDSRSMHVVFGELCWLQSEQIVSGQLYAGGEKH